MNKIEEIIESDNFKIELSKAIEEGKEIDYYFNGEDEVGYDTFDVINATNAVIKVIERFLL
jgi:hypothetical protein